MLICRLDKKFQFVDWTKNFDLSIGQKISICRLDKSKNFSIKKKLSIVQSINQN